MAFTIDGTRSVYTPKPKPKPPVKPVPVQQKNVKDTNSATKTGERSYSSSVTKLQLERTYRASKPKPAAALEQIKNLPQPNSYNKSEITDYKTEVKKIADNAIVNSERPNVRDFLNSNSGIFSRFTDYFQKSAEYNNQISTLKKFSADAVKYPNTTLTPQTAADDIDRLPRPDRNDSQAILAYNNQRAEIADRTLLYEPRPPKLDDFKKPGLNNATANAELERASRTYEGSMQQLTEAVNFRNSTTPPPINEVEAISAAENLIGKSDNEDEAFRLGQEIGKLSKTNPAEAVRVMSLVQGKLNGSEKGDNVASGFVNSLSDVELANVGQTFPGKIMLSNLKSHLLTGDVHDNEKIQAGRIDVAVTTESQRIASVTQKVETAYEEKGALEASKILREETEKLSPEATAQILPNVKPTTDKIIADLNSSAKPSDGNYNYDFDRFETQVSFDQTLANLSSVAGRVSQTPNGANTVKEFAAPIVEYIKENGVGRYDEALGKTIALGGGAELSVEVISQLQAAGKTGEADDILQNVEDGVKELKKNVEKSLEDYGKASEEFQWLVKNWGPSMDRDELPNAITNYMNDHPELNEKFTTLDNLAASTVRTLNTLTNLPDSMQSLGHFDDVQDKLGELINDEKTQSLITSMPGATQEFATLIKLQAEGQPTLLDKIKEPTGLISNFKGFGEKMADVLLKSTVSSAIEARLSGNFAKADQLIDNLKQYSGLLGVGDEDLEKAVDGLKDIQRADPANINNSLEELNKNLSVEKFAADQPLGRAFRSAGILLSLPGTIDSIKNISDVRSAAEALVGAVGLSADSAELFAGIIKGGKVAGFVDSAAFKAGGKVLGVVGLVFDGVSLIDNLTGDDKDLVNACFDAAALGGGAAILLAGGPVTLGIGAVVLLGAGIGKFIYGNTKEANKHETATTEKFLRDGGVNPNITRELRNQDGDGRSPAAVFAAVADKLNVPKQEFLDYLNTLPADKIHDLVETAHGVTPDDEGNFPDSVYDRPRRFEIPKPNDITDFIGWMRVNGFENAPGL